MGERGRVNLYGFVGNDPVNGADPFGLFAAGFNLEISTINPFTSGGGGSYGVNFEYTSDSGWHWYSYGTPNDVGSVGFLSGPSFTGNLAMGNGDWTGLFNSGGGSFGLVNGGFFGSPNNQPEPGYFGLYFGLGKGPPGVGFTTTNYKRMFPDKDIKCK